jgi:cell shape-determining protein MreD
MNSRLRAVVGALPVLVPFAAIVAGTLADLGWLRLVGIVFLVLVVAVAISKRGIQSVRVNAVPARYVAVAIAVLLASVAAILLMDTSLALLAIPLTAGSAAVLWILIALILRGLLRLHRGA